MNGWAVRDTALVAPSSSDIAALATTTVRPRASGQALTHSRASHTRPYSLRHCDHCVLPSFTPTLSENRTQGYVIRQPPRVHYLRIIVFTVIRSSSYDMQMT